MVASRRAGQHDWNSSWDKRDEEGCCNTEMPSCCTVFVENMPAAICGNAAALQAVFQQAGLGHSLRRIRLQMRPGSATGNLLVELQSTTAAEYCAKHFQNCRWLLSDGVPSMTARVLDGRMPYAQNHARHSPPQPRQGFSGRWSACPLANRRKRLPPSAAGFQVCDPDGLSESNGDQSTALRSDQVAGSPSDADSGPASLGGDACSEPPGQDDARQSLSVESMPMSHSETRAKPRWADIPREKD